MRCLQQPGDAGVLMGAKEVLQLQVAALAVPQSGIAPWLRSCRVQRHLQQAQVDTHQFAGGTIGVS